MRIIQDILYGTTDTENQVLDLYLPDGEDGKEADLLIWFHGGGLEAGDKADVSLTRLARQGKAVISANYRMYPTAVFPEFIEDAALVVKWAIDHMDEYKPVGKIFVGGSSAGAYLTAMLAFDQKYLEKHDVHTADIAGFIINSAQVTTHFNILRERGLDTRRIVVDEAAPVFFINETTEFPNIYVIVSDDDMPCRLEQNRMFLKTLEMFECPREKVRHKLMEGFTHCGYDDTEEFMAMVMDYMNSNG